MTTEVPSLAPTRLIDRDGLVLANIIRLFPNKASVDRQGITVGVMGEYECRVLCPAQVDAHDGSTLGVTDSALTPSPGTGTRPNRGSVVITTCTAMISPSPSWIG